MRKNKYNDGVEDSERDNIILYYTNNIIFIIILCNNWVSISVRSICKNRQKPICSAAVEFDLSRTRVSSLTIFPTGFTYSRKSDPSGTWNLKGELYLLRCVSYRCKRQNPICLGRRKMTGPVENGFSPLKNPIHQKEKKSKSFICLYFLTPSLGIFFISKINCGYGILGPLILLGISPNVAVHDLSL